MAILGIDYGEKKAGLAISVSDDMAVPLEVFRYQNSDALIQRIGHVCEERGVDVIVVGVPIGLKGSGVRPADLRNSQTKKVLKFVELLKNSLGKQVVCYDERMSTKAAEELLRGHKKTDDDAVAAMVILQNFLENKKIQKK